MDTSATTRLFPALIHHIEGIIAAIATVGGGWVILRQFLYTNRIFFTSVWGWIWENTTSYGTDQRQPDITQQSNGVGVRFLCGDYGREAFIWGIMPDFYYFGASKMGWLFHLFWNWWHPIECLWDDTTINKPISGMSIDGVCNASWLWRVDWTNVGTIFVSELVPHIPSVEQPFWQ